MRFNGKDFADFGVHVDESKAFGSPEKDYELVEIMGRNGNLSIYNDRFKDITLPFPCFIRTGFIEKYRSLLAYLNSQTGYQRLETDKEPNHFRKALFQGIVDPQTTAFNHGGFFTLNLLAHPQRYLKSGEIPVSASSQSNTYTGNPVEIDNPSGISAVSSLAVALDPIQTGTGEPSPTNIRPITGHTSANVTRTGKNLLQINNNVVSTYTHNGVTYTFDRDSQGNLLSITANGTATGGNSFVIISVFTNMQYLVGLGKPIKLSGASNEGGRARLQWWSYDGSGATAGDNGNGSSAFIPTSTAGNVAIQVSVNETVHNAVYKPMILLADETDRTYEPYVSNTYTIDLNGTRYGGTVDLATGVLTLTKGFKNITASDNIQSIGSSGHGWQVLRSSFDNPPLNKGANYSDGIICDRLKSEVGASSVADDVCFVNTSGVLRFNLATVYADKTALFNAIGEINVAYPIEPQTIQLTPQQISLLTGINYISSSDEVTVTVTEPSLLENPTLFESKPLIRVYGNGTLVINHQYITVAENPYEFIDIDCDMMDCYYEGTNASQYVSFSTTDYVVLKSGANYIAYSGRCEITPRWYEV